MNKDNNNIFQSSSYFKLDKAFFIRMLDLEKLFYSKEINMKQLGEVVGMYARCVEYYDSIKDDSKYYYMDKIQYVLSRKESLEQIFKAGAQETIQQDKNNMKNDNNLLVSDFVIDLNYGDPNKDDREFKINSIKCSVTGTNQPRESVNRRKLQGEYKMNIDYYEHRNEQDQKVQHIVEETELNFGKNDEIIKKDLNDQDELLMQRIAKKKAKLNQKKKQIKKANSFDENDMNQNGRINNDINSDIAEGHNNNDNHIQSEINRQSLYSNKTPPINDIPMSKQDQINELKETFDLSYSKLFNSISHKNNKQSVSKKQPSRFVVQENKTGDIKQSLASSSIFENKDEDQTRDSQGAFYNKATEDNLESIFSAHGGRITMRENPFDEESDDDFEKNAKNKKKQDNKNKN